MKKAIINLGALLALSSCVHYNEFRKEVNLNEDSLPELVELKDGAVYVYERIDMGTEKPAYSPPVRLTEDYQKVTDLKLVDWDKDGNLDLLLYLGDQTNPEYRVMLGKGDGTFTIDMRVQ